MHQIFDKQLRCGFHGIETQETAIMVVENEMYGTFIVGDE